MAATHYTQWIYNKIVGTDFAVGKRFEIRFTFGTDKYDYGVSNPTDCIYLDQLKIVDFGKTKWQRYDESCSLVAANRTIEFRDQYFFSGTVNGSPTGTIDLTTDKTSLLPFLLQSTTDTCFMHLSQLNADGSLKEIYFSGILDTELIDGNVIQMVLPMGSNERKLQTKKYLFITAASELGKHTVEELVSGSRTAGIPDNRVSGFVQSDMASIPGHTKGRGAWYLGLVAKQGVDYNTIPDLQKYKKPDEDTFQICSLTSATSMPVPGVTIFNGYKNCYGVEDGFQGLSYTTIISKIGDICRFTFSSSDTDDSFSQYLPSYTTYTGGYDRYNLSQIGDPHLSNVLYVNYNFRFGVKPSVGMDSNGNNALHNISAVNSGLVPTFTVVAATNATPIVVTLNRPLDAIVGTSMMFCNVDGCTGNTNANTAVTCTVIDSTHVSLQDASGVDIAGNGAYTGNGLIAIGDASWFQLSSPCTWARTDTLADLMKRICFRFGWLMDFDIWQSGTNKGRPKIILRNILKSSGSIPSAWTDPNNPTLLKGITISERQQTIKNVRLGYVGDDSKVYCPTDKGESFDIEIHGRAKQWGRKFIYLPQHFTNNASLDINSQWQTSFSASIDGSYLLNQSSWVIGACDFYKLDADPGIYNSNFTATHFLDQSFAGYYPVTYEEYFGNNSKDWDARLPSANTIHDGIYATPETFFNTACSKAKYYANIFLNSLTVEKRSFRTSVDDSGNIRTLRPNLTGTWLDENGVATSKLLHSIEIDEIRGISDCEFTPALADYTSLTDYTVLVSNPGGGSTGGIIGGAGGSGAGGNSGVSDLTNAIIKSPNTPIRNTITGDTSGDTALTIVGSEDLPPLAVTVANGQNDDVSILDTSGISRSSIVLTGPTAVFSVTGWTNGTDGKVLYVRNATAFDCTFKDNIGSGSNDQIRTPNHADYTIPQDGGVLFRYETSDTRWHLLSDAQTIDAHDIVDNPSATQTIQATATGVVPLKLRKYTGTSADVFEVTDTDGTTMFLQVTSGGVVEVSKQLVLLNTTTGLGLDTGSGIDFGTSGYVLKSNGSSSTPAWVSPSSLVSGLYVLLDPSGNQTIQSTTTANVQFILKMRSGDTAATPIFNIKNASGTSVYYIDNTGTVDTFGQIRLEKETVYSNVLELDIASFLTGLNILDLDTQGRMTVRLTDTSGNTGSIYNLCGIVAYSVGGHLEIFLDDTFASNGNSITLIHESATETTAANRIHEPYSLNPIFHQIDLVYMNRGGTPRWMPKWN